MLERMLARQTAQEDQTFRKLEARSTPDEVEVALLTPICERTFRQHTLVEAMANLGLMTWTRRKIEMGDA